MQVVWNFCKSKMVCEPDEPKEENDQMDVEEAKKGHGGCGAAQPLIRKEGLKLFVQYKRSKDEDEVCTYHGREAMTDRGETILISGVEVPSARQASFPSTRSLHRPQEDLGFGPPLTWTV